MRQNLMFLVLDLLNAHAPSLSFEELAAVLVPSLMNAALSWGILALLYLDGSSSVSIYYLLWKQQLSQNNHDFEQI